MFESIVLWRVELLNNDTWYLAEEEISMENIGDMASFLLIVYRIQ